MRQQARWRLLGVAAGALLAVTFLAWPGEASGWIAWNPDTGVYWTEDATVRASLEIRGDDEVELRALFEAIAQMPREEQHRVLEQVRVRVLERSGGPGGAVPVVEVEAVYQAGDLYRLRDRVQERLRERVAIQAGDGQQATAGDDGDDGEAAQQDNDGENEDKDDSNANDGAAGNDGSAGEHNDGNSHEHGAGRGRS